MKYGILGDIHANLSALETVLARFEALRVERVLSVGDVVGYGAAPSACIELLREHDAVVVRGNHDAAVVGQIDLLYFNHAARDAVRWTQSQLSTQECRWLAELPYVAELEHCAVSHGTLHRPELFDYVQSPRDADPSLDEMRTVACFIGHTHVPKTLLRMRDDPLRTAHWVDEVLDLREVQCALVNVGSVGQPRDDDPRAAFAIYDSAKAQVSIRRVEYDVEREAARIRAAGLPDVLAQRLFLGV